MEFDKYEYGLIMEYDVGQMTAISILACLDILISNIPKIFPKLVGSIAAITHLVSVLNKKNVCDFLIRTVDFSNLTGKTHGSSRKIWAFN